MSPAANDAAVVIRPARPDDLTAVAAVFLHCWRVSYRGVLPAAVIDVYDEAGAVDLWRRAVTAPPAGRTVLVADVAGRGVRGVVSCGADPDRPELGHIFSLYVDPDAQDLGLGRRLIAAAEAALSHAGHHAATLWVFAANAASIGFYAHHGWRPDGGQRTEAAYGEPELRLHRELAAG